MNKPRVLITTPDSPMRSLFFNEGLYQRVGALCHASWNPHARYLQTEELKSLLTNIEVLFTSWHSPKLSASVLEAANSLKLVLHLGGSVADVTTPEFFDRGIPICSLQGRTSTFLDNSL